MLKTAFLNVICTLYIETGFKTLKWNNINALKFQSEYYYYFYRRLKSIPIDAIIPMYELIRESPYKKICALCNLISILFTGVDNRPMGSLKDRMAAFQTQNCK